jgi:hypothetical protein
MARRPDSQISTALTSLLPRRRIRALARRLGVVRRRRKLDIVALVYSLVLGFSVGERRTLSGLRRACLRATGVRLAPSSFHARFSAALTQLLRALVLEAIEQLGRVRPGRGPPSPRSWRCWRSTRPCCDCTTRSSHTTRRYSGTT